MVTQAREAASHNGTLNGRITVVETRASDKVRRLYQLEGLQGSEMYTTFNNSLHNNLKALNERVYNVRDKKTGALKPPPQPVSEDFFDQALCEFEGHLNKYIKPITPYNIDEIPGFYSGAKRTIYEKAVLSLKTCPLDVKDSYLSAFVKDEKTSVVAKPWEEVVPRLIQPPSYRYSASLACYIKRIDPLLATAIDNLFNDVTGADRSEKTIMKGLNAEQIGEQIFKKWSRINKCVAIGLDASRFDQHVSTQALSWEHKQYLRFVKGNRKSRRKFKRMLDWQLSTRGYINCPDGHIKYEVDGTRASGQQNTTSGNCLISCAMVYALVKKLKITNFALIDMGDDMVLFVSEKNRDKVMAAISEHFLDYGFSMKVEDPVYLIEEVDFCQQRPVFDGQKYIMVRNPFVSMSKDSVSLKPLLSPRVTAAFMQSIGKGGLRLTGGLPIMQDFYQSMLDGSLVFCKDQRRIDSVKAFKQSEQWGSFYFAHGQKRGYADVHWRARASYATAFGIPRMVQLEMEKYIRSIKFANEVREGQVEHIARRAFN